MLTSRTMAVSFSLAFGTINFLYPSSLREITMGRAPRMAEISPFN